MITASGQPAEPFPPPHGLVLSANVEVAQCGLVEGKDVRAGFPALIFKPTYLPLCVQYMQHFFHWSQPLTN